jgi:hypothetical protein
MPIHPAAIPANDLLRHCDLTRTRRGGPGGQHRNKVETAVVITHLPTGLTGQASERRSQDLNRQAALHRLRVNLALTVRMAAEPNDQSSELWRKRVRAGRIAVNGEHDDFPALLAEALDRLAECDWDVGAAAIGLEVSASQVVKFLQVEPRALELLNAQRIKRGLKKLR